MKTRLGSDANVMVPEFCSNTGYMQSCLLYKLKCTGIYISSAKLASWQHGTDSRHGLRKSHVTLPLHQAWFKSRLCAQMLQFPLYWWKTCIRWRLNIYRMPLNDSFHRIEWKFMNSQSEKCKTKLLSLQALIQIFSLILSSVQEGFIGSFCW